MTAARMQTKLNHQMDGTHMVQKPQIANSNKQTNASASRLITNHIEHSTAMAGHSAKVTRRGTERNPRGFSSSASSDPKALGTREKRGEGKKGRGDSIDRSPTTLDPAPELPSVIADRWVDRRRGGGGFGDWRGEGGGGGRQAKSEEDSLRLWPQLRLNRTLYTDEIMSILYLFSYSFLKYCITVSTHFYCQSFYFEPPLNQLFFYFGLGNLWLFFRFESPNSLYYHVYPSFW